jgi:microcystin-dependent protein
MSEAYLGEVRLFGFGITPNGWAQCNGQIMSINQYQALFALLGTTYGGNGQSTFALPDLRGRAPAQPGNTISLGAAGGAESHTLLQPEMPMHNHLISGSSNPPTLKGAAGSLWATQTANAYAQGNPDTILNPAAIGNAGGSQAHENRQPYLSLNFCIALTGIFPSRN